MAELIVLTGLPASGKTTWALQQVAEKGWKRVNRDDLRFMIDGGSYSEEHEETIREARNALIVTLLKRGHTVVVDDTNLTFLSTHNEMRALTDECAATLAWKSFQDVPLEECVRRDALRDKPVGEDVIRSLHDRYIVKRWSKSKRRFA